MLRSTGSLSRRALFTCMLAAVTITAAGAATYHRLAVTQSAGGGSGGATEFLQSSATGGAVQGEVATSAYKSLPDPFGLFGFYHGSSSSTFGIGTLGISSTGYGVAGAGEGSSPAILAVANGTGPALEAVTTMASNSSPAIDVEDTNGASADGIDADIGPGSTATHGAVAAVSGLDIANQANQNGGILGLTQGDAFGVLGIVTPDGNGGPSGQAGVIGESTGLTTGSGIEGNPSESATSAAVGVVGVSSSGVGVAGRSSVGSGFKTDQRNTASPAPTVNSRDGILASAQNGAGVYAYSFQDPAIAAEMGCNVAIQSPTENGQNCSGLFIQMDGTAGYPILTYEPGSTQTCPNPKYPFFVNGAGDILLCGSTSTGEVYQRNSNPASDAVAYAAKQTESTVEDFGSAQLVNGSATVPLAADFRETIDADSAYMVFATPHGDSRGLYLASQSHNGFVIRESQGGHSTMAFDYRIVARPYGRRLARLPEESQVGAERPGGSSVQRTSYAQLIAAAHTRDRVRVALHNNSSTSKLHPMHPRRYVPRPIPASFARALKRLDSAATQ